MPRNDAAEARTPQKSVRNNALSTVQNEFDRFATSITRANLAEGLSAAFQSNRTRAFETIISTLFGRSTGEQRASVLDIAIATVGGTLVADVLSQIGAAELASAITAGRFYVRADEAMQISVGGVEELASRAAERNPVFVDRIGNFYSEYPELVKTLGTGFLIVLLEKIRRRG